MLPEGRILPLQAKADRDGIVDHSHMFIVQMAHMLPQAAFIDGAHLFQQNHRVLAQPHRAPCNIDKLKTCASSCGFVDMKTYKANPEAHIGNIADASNIVRIALTGKTTTPDLYEIMKLLGESEVNARFDYVINSL